jgi:putative copper export protein
MFCAKSVILRRKEAMLAISQVQPYIILQDVAQKLSHMMWNDWEKTVRTAASQALGRTGNGKVWIYP